MALAIGSRLGPYEILSAIGAGGMGEVYHARDTRLKRDVALKILPESFASDRERLARFQREAEVLASLSHPNIAGIYGLEEADGVKALVMELVEGEDLSQRIARGAIPLDEALPIAKQIAEALDAAHEEGIIHRDLKPANIKVRPDGTVKVLDFGLAKLAASSGSPTSDASLSPTITSPAMMTGVGVLLGTAAYMSPEQATGKATDKRTDLWAFGVVLLEMLTGRPVFAGETVSYVLASVLKDEPNWSLLPPHTPPAVRRLLRRCLQKDRKRRLPDAADIRLEIDESLTTQAADASDTAGVRSSFLDGRFRWLIAAVGILAAAAVAIPAWRHLREVPLKVPIETRVDIVTPATTDPASFNLSPDGRQIVFAALADGRSKLWVRSLGSTSAQPLTGTDGARFPFWSPDGQAVGFFADGQLKIADMHGGSPRKLTTSTLGRGGTWSVDGVIVFAGSSVGPLSRVSASGGNAVVATKLAEGQANHRFPFFLPDGHHFVFYAQGGPDTNGIYLGSLDSSLIKRLTPGDTSAIYLASGWLLWVRAGALVAQRLDLERQELVGDTVTIADAVFEGDNNSAALSASVLGLIAYRTGGAERHQLTWVDRAGKVLGVASPPDDNVLRSPSLSDDGRRIAVSRTVQGNSDIWVLDGARMSRFTFDPGADQFPLWSPSGRRIVFRSIRSQPQRLYMKDANSASAETPLPYSDGSSTNANDWSKDGQFLLYQVQGSKTDFDLWVLPMKGDTKPWVFVQTPFRDRNGRFSPDGRWVAYMSDESGHSEIYIRPFSSPTSAGQWQVSTAGGLFPSWRPDGRELYYVAPDGNLMAVQIAIQGTTPDLGTPVALFAPHMYGGGIDNLQGRQYDVTPDGRFLINTVLDDVGTSPITLIQSWTPRVTN